MKKFIMCCLVLLLCLVGCSSTQGKIKEYELSEKESEILDLVRIKDRIYGLDYQAPKNTMQLLVKYVHLEGNQWIEDDRSFLLSDTSDIGSGRIGIFIKEDFTIEFNYDHGISGVISTYISEMPLKKMPNGIAFLDGSQKIELNEEVPIALLSYGAGEGLDFFYNPIEKEENERVEAITISFLESEDR